MRSLSGIEVGETKEMHLYRRIPKWVSYTTMLPETKLQRWIRLFMRRPRATQQVEYKIFDTEEITVVEVVGTETGIELREMQRR